ncbi:MAG: sugar transferase [Cyclobacteriaceae bacterium]
MKNKEIVLVDLPERTEGFLGFGFQVSNFEKLSQVLLSASYRIENDFKIPDFIVINNDHIDSSEFQNFIGALKNFGLSIPCVIIDRTPSEEMKETFRRLGAGDYLDGQVSDLNIVRQLKRLDRFNVTRQERLKRRSYISFEKRAFDICCSLLILILISPILFLVMLAIRLESKGPIFYWQPRVGTGYKIFNFYKFRSMRVDADQMIDQLAGLNHYDEKETTCEVNDNPTTHLSTDMLVSDDKLIKEENFIQEQIQSTQKSFVKFENDPRITKVGHWIRKTSIDELPQLFNVLIGDMSLVGNRPLPLYEAETLTSDEWTERFMAPAGITGLWQVTERGKKATSADSRKLLDNEYARKNNLLLDLKILLKTPLAAIQQENV